MIGNIIHSPTKTCKRCNHQKPLGEFGNHARSKDGKSCYCKICQQLFRSDWVKRNKDHQARLEREWALKNNEKVKQLRKDYYAANKEKYTEKRKRMYEKHREKRLEYAKRLRLEKREWYNQLQRLRDANCKQAMPKWANKKTMNSIYRQAKNMQKSDGVLRHVDHIVPLNHPLVSGLHCEFNLQILTAKENISKKNKFDPNNFVHEFP